MRRRVALAVLTVAVVFGPVLVVPTPAAALPIVNVAITDAAIAGLRYESHSVFTLDLAAKAVHVQVAITVTNEQPSTTSGNVIRQFYFPRIGVPVLSEATNFVATKDTGASLNVNSENTESPHFNIATVDLKPALFYRQTQNIQFGYDLPGQAPRTESLTRINDAFSSFLAFGFGDPGITSVQVKVPTSLTTEIVGVDMKREVFGDQTVFTADPLDDPDTWTAGVDARNDAGLVQKDESVDGQHIVIKGWPDDPQWVDFVDAQLKSGLTALEGLIGQPWPDASKDLTVTETAAPYLYGYAGWYNPLQNAIEIGDSLDAIVVLHEISHTWFNKDLFTDRWVNEAFANEFASRALEKVGQPLQSPDAVTFDSPGSFKLNDWGRPKLQDSSTTDQEHFGYDASWTVLRTISTEVGMSALTKVVDAASHKLIAYQGHPAPEEAVNRADWKRLLDLLEEVGGSKAASDLFKNFVVGTTDAALFARRSTARAAYKTFVDASGDWSAPLAVRSAMGQWSFSEADDLISEAEQILQTRIQIADTLRPLGRAVPPSLQQHYESQGGADLRAVADEANLDLDAARHIVDANNAVHAGHGVVGTLGLFLAGADDKVHRAERALEQGDGAAAIRLADSARSQANDATRAGAIRLVVLLLVLAAGFAAWTWGRPLARRTLETRAEKKRVAAAPAQPATWSEWMPPPPPPTDWPPPTPPTPTNWPPPAPPSTDWPPPPAPSPPDPIPPRPPDNRD